MSVKLKDLLRTVCEEVEPKDEKEEKEEKEDTEAPEKKSHHAKDEKKDEKDDEEGEKKSHHAKDEKTKSHMDSSDDDGIMLGSQVKIADIETLNADQLGLTDDQFTELQDKVDSDTPAIVFNIEDDDSSLVDIIFQDAFIVTQMPRTALELLDIQHHPAAFDDLDLPALPPEDELPPMEGL